MAGDIAEAKEADVAQMPEDALNSALTDENQSGKPVEDIIPDPPEEAAAPPPEETSPPPTTEGSETETETETETKPGESPPPEEETEASTETPPAEETPPEEEPGTETPPEPNPELDALKARVEKVEKDRDQMSQIVRRQGTEISERNKIIERLKSPAKPAAKPDGGTEEDADEALTQEELDARIEKKLAEADFENLKAKESDLEAKQLLMSAVPELEQPDFKNEMIELALKDGAPQEDIERFKADPYIVDPGSILVYAERVRVARNEKVLQDRVTGLEAEIAALKKTGTEKLAKKIDAAATQPPQVSAASGGASPATKPLGDGQISQMTDEELDSDLDQSNLKGKK